VYKNEAVRCNMLRPGGSDEFTNKCKQVIEHSQRTTYETHLAHACKLPEAERPGKFQKYARKYAHVPPSSVQPLLLAHAEAEAAREAAPAKKRRRGPT
jgi:hypothetical protein